MDHLFDVRYAWAPLLESLAMRHGLIGAFQAASSQEYPAVYAGQILHLTNDPGGSALSIHLPGDGLPVFDECIDCEPDLHIKLLSRRHAPIRCD